MGRTQTYDLPTLLSGPPTTSDFSVKFVINDEDSARDTIQMNPVHHSAILMSRASIGTRLLYARLNDDAEAQSRMLSTGEPLRYIPVLQQELQSMDRVKLADLGERMELWAQRIYRKAFNSLDDDERATILTAFQVSTVTFHDACADQGRGLGLG